MKKIAVIRNFELENFKVKSWIDSGKQSGTTEANWWDLCKVFKIIT